MTRLDFYLFGLARSYNFLMTVSISFLSTNTLEENNLDVTGIEPRWASTTNLLSIRCTMSLGYTSAAPQVTLAKTFYILSLVALSPCNLIGVKHRDFFLQKVFLKKSSWKTFRSRLIGGNSFIANDFIVGKEGKSPNWPIRPGKKPPGVRPLKASCGLNYLGRWEDLTVRWTTEPL